MVGGQASNEIGKLRASQVTKTVLQDGSTEPVWANWDGREANG